MKEKIGEGRANGPGLLSNYHGATDVHKTERRPHVLNVPVRIGRRKLRCYCGGRLLVKKIGLTDFFLECEACGEGRAVSIIATVSNGVRA